MKKLLFFSIILMGALACSKNDALQELVGEWENTEISYYYDNTKLTMDYDTSCDYYSYRFWAWDNDVEYPTECVVDAEQRPGIIINSDGSAQYGNTQFRASYADNLLTLKSNHGTKKYMVSENILKAEEVSFERVYGYSLTENGVRQGYDGKVHTIKCIIVWSKR